MKKISKNNIIFIILVVLTLIRLWLGVRTPLLLQADARYDDFLFVRYAEELLNGNWLGNDSLSLAKSASFSVILALGYLLGIPYNFGLYVLYILACILISIAFYYIIKNKYFCYILYLFLLYSPIMFHEENVQKVYRGGYIVIFAIIVFASVIAQFGISFERNVGRKALVWALVGSVALPVFWLMKEDSIWILPFVCAATGITLLSLKISHGKIQKKLLIRMFIAVLPLLVLAGSILVYKGVNYKYYGAFTITDRSGTHFKNVIEDLIQIEDPNVGDTWITRNMIREAAENSGTLSTIMGEVEQICNERCGDDGEIHGDIIIWALREAANRAGVYNDGWEAADNFYGRIHEELQDAFERGDLKKSTGKIYISSISRGFTAKELTDYYLKQTPVTLKMLLTYSENAITVTPASGDYENIALMDEIVNSHFTWKDAENSLNRKDAEIVSLENKIVGLYQKTGMLIFGAAFVGTLLLCVRAIRQYVRKQMKTSGQMFLIITGMVLTSILLILAIQWFCSFLSLRKIYDYLSCAVILIQIAELTGIYYLIKSLKQLIRNRNGKTRRIES